MPGITFFVGRLIVVEASGSRMEVHVQDQVPGGAVIHGKLVEGKTLGYPTQVPPLDAEVLLFGQLKGDEETGETYLQVAAFTGADIHHHPKDLQIPVIANFLKALADLLDKVEGAASAANLIASRPLSETPQ